MTSDRSQRRESLSGRAFNIKNHDYRKKGDHFSKGSEDNEIVKDIAYGGSVVNINGAKKWREAGTHGALMEELGTIKGKDVWLEPTAKIIHTLTLPITTHGCARQSVMRADGKVVFH